MCMSRLWSGIEAQMKLRSGKATMPRCRAATYAAALLAQTSVEGTVASYLCVLSVESVLVADKYHKQQVRMLFLQPLDLRPRIQHY